MKIVTWRNFGLGLGAAVALMAAVGSQAQDKVPVQFQGDWVPATAGVIPLCDFE